MASPADTVYNGFADQGVAPPETYSLPNGQRWIGPVGPSSNTPRRKGLPQLSIDINPRENGKVIRPAHMPHMVRNTRIKPALTIGIYPNPTSEWYKAVRSPRADSPEPEVSEPPSELMPNSPIEPDNGFEEAFAAHMQRRAEVHQEESAVSSPMRNCSTCSKARSHHSEVEASPKPITPWNNEIKTMAQGDPEYRRQLEREYWIDLLQRSGDEGFHDWFHLYSHDIDSPLVWFKGQCTCPWSRDPWSSFCAVSRRVRNRIPYPKASSASMPSTAEAIAEPSRGNGKFKPVDFSDRRIDDTENKSRSPAASKHSSGPSHSGSCSPPAAAGPPHYSAIHTSEFIPIHLGSPRLAEAQQAGTYPFDLPNRWSSLPGSEASGSSGPWMGASVTQHPRTLDVELRSPIQLQQDLPGPMPYAACRGTSLPSTAEAGPAGIGESTAPVADKSMGFPFNLRSPGLTRDAPELESVELSKSAQSDSINYRAPELTSAELDNDGRHLPQRSNSEILAELGRQNAIYDGFSDPTPVYTEYITASPEVMSDQGSVNATADGPFSDRTPRSPRYSKDDLTRLRDSLRSSGLGSHQSSQQAPDSPQSQRFVSIDLQSRHSHESAVHDAPSGSGTALYIIHSNNELHDDYDVESQTNSANSRIVTDTGSAIYGMPTINELHDDYYADSETSSANSRIVTDSGSALGSHCRSQQAADSPQSQRFVSVDLQSRHSHEHTVQNAPSDSGSALYIIPTNDELHEDYDVESQTSSANSRPVTDPLIPRAPSAWLPNRVQPYLSGTQGTAILIVLVIITDILLFGILYTMVAHFHLMVAK
ncbi:hypothetical protein CC79DRAFT_1397867 [Sarocladium strictum]